MASINDYSENYFENQLSDAGSTIEDDLESKDIPKAILNLVPVELATQYHILPLELSESNKLVVATDNEQAYKQRTYIEEAIGRKIELRQVEETNIRMALFKFYDIQNYSMLSKHSEVDEDMTPLKGKLNALLQDAAEQNASDIHLLPTPHGIRVDFRINGHMHDMTNKYLFTREQVGNVIILIKRMDTSGSSDIMKTNMPNEGSFNIIRGGQEIFVRLETLPVGNGTEGLEKINLRLLPQAARGNHSRKTLDDIGYISEDLQGIKSALFRNATGLFLNSGPTGAGKSTSLHAEIHYVLDSLGEHLNVIEIAEPIEIYEEEFTQVQTRKSSSDSTNLTAEKILEASLRSDPDIILYNEIRNSIDATVAMQASNTGHRVFSTVHAADVTRTISRLLDFDISRTTLLSELKLIISQRLVATLCPHCSRPHILSSRERSVLTAAEIEKIQGKARERGPYSEVEACPHCNHGYSGRTAIAEYITFNTDIRDALMSQNTFAGIQAILKRNGFRTMWEKGMDMVENGYIELDELIRVVGKD